MNVGDKKHLELKRTEVTSKIDQLLHQYCLDKIKAAKPIGPSYVELWQEIDAYIAGGGKRIRPYLVALTYGAYGGDDLDSILPIACAWELIHACLLVHDDIIDRDIVRHGILNIAGVYEKKYEKIAKNDTVHYAQSAAILAGDLLLTAAYEIVGRSTLSSEDKLHVGAYLQSALFSVGGGELIDSESVLTPIIESDPVSIAHYKTATYSFQLPLQCGAFLARVSKTELQNLDKIGLELGIAFQLSDDLLGVFGDEAQTGKSNRSDIYEKKRTLLVQITQQQLTSDQKEHLEHLYNLNHELTRQEAEEVFLLIESSGAQQIVENQIAERAANARKLVAELEVSSVHKQILYGLIEKVTVRNK